VLCSGNATVLLEREKVGSDQWTVVSEEKSRN